jgi:hypothetical protein
MTDLWMRIEQRLEALGKSAHRASLEAGKSRDWLRVLRTQKSTPRGDNLAILAKVLDTSPEWLLTGVEQNPEGAASTLERLPAIFRTLPVSHEVQAGAFQEVFEVDEPLGEELVAVHPAFPTERQWLARVRGDSMNLRAPEGSLAHVIDAVAIGYVPQDGHMVEVERRRAGGQMIERTLKEVRWNTGSIELWPRSSNPKWSEPVVLTDGAAGDVEVVIVGLVVQIVSKTI